MKDKVLVLTKPLPQETHVNVQTRATTTYRRLLPSMTDNRLRECLFCYPDQIVLVPYKYLADVIVEVTNGMLASCVIPVPCLGKPPPQE